MGEVIRKTKNGKFVGWYIRFIDADGQRKQRASKQPSATLARRMLVEIEARVARGKAGIVEEKQHENLTVAELFQAFLARFMSPRIKDMARYRERLAILLRRVVKVAPSTIMRLPASDLSRSHVAQIRDALSQRYPAGTVRTSLQGLSAALSWGVREELLERNSCHGVEQPPPPQRIDEWLNAEEISKLLCEAKRGGGDLQAHSRFVAIALGVYLGLRRGEIFGLRWRDLDLRDRRIAVARSYSTSPKNGRTRHLRLPVALVPILSEWQLVCPATSDGLVCPLRSGQSWRMAASVSCPLDLPGLFRTSGIRCLTRPWHGLRHSFASNYLASGGSLLALQRILGHAEVRTTMVYAHLSNEFLDGELDRLKF